MQDVKNSIRTDAELASAADKVLEQAIEADGQYGIAVDPDVAEYMGISIYDSIEGHEEE